MIFKIRRANENGYYKHSQTGEIRDWANVPKRSESVNDPHFINNIAWYALDEWERMSGPMPIPGVNGDTIELNTIDELIQLIEITGYPMIIVHNIGGDPNYLWELKVYDDYVE